MRAILIGILLVILVNILSPYLAMSLSIIWVTNTQLSPLVIFIFLIPLLSNAALKRWSPRMALSGKELVIIFVMMMVGITVTNDEIVAAVIGLMSGYSYYATPENNWQEVFFQFLPKWLMVSDQQAIEWFYVGLPRGQSIPWMAWVKPLVFGWLPFIGVLLFVVYCSIAIFHRQWTQRERLNFPLMELPTQLATIREGKAFPELFQNKLFWAGVLVAGIIQFVYEQDYTQTIKPFFCFLIKEYRISLYPLLPVSLGSPVILFPVFAFAYFVNLEILFSLWFFGIVFVVIRGITSKVGFTIGEDIMGGFNAYLGTGAFLSVILFGIWRARDHLGKIFKDALRFRKPADDAAAIMGYRLAVWGLVLGFIFLVGWLYATGMSWITAAFMVLLSLILFLGLARMVSEGGLIMFRGCTIPQVMITGITGVNALTPASITSLGLCHAWIGDPKCIFSVAAAHGSRLKELFNVPRRVFAWSIVAAVLVGLIVALGTTIHLGYHGGVVTMSQQWYLNRAVNLYYNGFIKKGIQDKTYADRLKGRLEEAKTKGESKDVIAQLKTDIAKFGINIRKLITILVGAACGLVLVMLRQAFYWWPLHPIGFMAAGSDWVTSVILSSVFIAWAIKAAILKYGGVRAFRRGRPFFLGLVFGYSTGVALGLLVNQLFGFYV